MQITRSLGIVALFVTPLLVSAPASAGGSWQKHLPPIATRPTGGGSPWLRTLIHMHSVYSHDACDKKPFKNGFPNERCLEDFRKALCEEHVDLVFITEHRDELITIPMAEMIPAREDDRMLVENGSVVGAEHTCADGHRVTMFMGAENTMMPLGLTRHPELVPGLNLEQTYNALSPEAAQRFRDAGAIVAMSHAEEEKKSIEVLRAIRPELIEAYNLHANLIQDAYPKRRYGKVLKTVAEALSFITNPLVEPDLIFHAFFKENDKALKKWGQLAADYEVTGIAGTDAHQNALPFNMWDGQRVDSYRRSVRWFSNWVRLPQAPTRLQALDALKSGRSMVVFETLGDPAGFDFSGRSRMGTHAMGDRIDWASVSTPASGGGLTLRIAQPASKPSPVTTRLLRATSEGWVQIAESQDEVLEFEVREPGAYRAELWMNPAHLKKHLTGKRHLVKPMPWVYSNPIYVR